MTDALRTAAQAALEALDLVQRDINEATGWNARSAVADDLRAALAAQPQGEPAKRCAWPDCPHGADCVHAVAAPAPQPQGAQHDCSAAFDEAYSMVDRFLRNNLFDDDYAEYSAALDSLIPPTIQGAQRVAQPLTPFTPAQRGRLYANSPEHHKDATSRAGFERIVTLTERAHGIGEQA